MTCSDDVIARLLAGELEPGPTADADAHLLACERCWRAVCDHREGRAAARQLREPAPPELAERIRRAVAASDAKHAQPARRYVAALVLACVALLVAPIVGDPAPGGSLERAIAAATDGAGVARVDTFVVDGEEVVVALADGAVAMPAAAVGGATVDGAAWTLRLDGVTVVCTRGDRVVVAGRMSAERLVAVAGTLGYA